MTRAAEAAALFREGRSCGQAIFEAFGAQWGLPRDLVRRFGAPLAGGGGGDGTCGALTAAALILGLRYGGGESAA